MSSLRNVTYSHHKLSFLALLFWERAYKWVSPKLKPSRVGLCLPLPQKWWASMTWHLFIDSSLKTLVLSWLPWPVHEEWKFRIDKGHPKIKSKLRLTLILALPAFELLFEVKCDVSGIGIGVVLTQAKWPLAYFSKKLSGLKFDYSTYGK